MRYLPTWTVGTFIISESSVDEHSSDFVHTPELIDGWVALHLFKQSISLTLWNGLPQDGWSAHVAVVVRVDLYLHLLALRNL